MECLFGLYKFEAGDQTTLAGWQCIERKNDSAIREDEYPTFASTWMGLEEIMLSEISQAEKVNYHMVSLVEHKE